MFVTRARKDGFQVGLHPLEPTPPGTGPGTVGLQRNQSHSQYSLYRSRAFLQLMLARWGESACGCPSSSLAALVLTTGDGVY
eukprot:1436755-Rhodomonas_salina.2